METAQKQFYRDQLRSARAAALADAEGFQAVLHSLEMIGQQLLGKVDGLGKYECELSRLAGASPFSSFLPTEWPEFHTTFRALYSELRRARNDAVHQGARARTLTTHAVELTIILEDALMTDAAKVSQFMVRDVVEAKPWHPVSHVRQQMLKYAFSYIPIRTQNGWHLISDGSLARFLRMGVSLNNRKRRLAARIDKVPSEEALLSEADTDSPETPLHEIVERISERPILIIDPHHEGVLLGLVTASDVL